MLDNRYTQTVARERGALRLRVLLAPGGRDARQCAPARRVVRYRGDLVGWKALEGFLVGNQDLERLDALLDHFNIFEATGWYWVATRTRGAKEYRLLRGSSEMASFTTSRSRRLDNLARSSLTPHYLHGWPLR
jgi:hypothetical protein